MICRILRITSLLVLVSLSLQELKPTFSFELIESKDFPLYADVVATKRKTSFKEYPYLYDGEQLAEYEASYLNSYMRSEQARLVIGKDDQKNIIAIFTGIPLQSDSEIIAGCPELFKQNNLDPKDYFYIGEMIIDKEYQGMGHMHSLIQLLEREVIKLGYKNACFLTVIRDRNDPRKPGNYRDTEALWEHFGCTKTNITTTYHWPTFTTSDLSISEDIENTLVFWIKNIEPKTIE